MSENKPLHYDTLQVHAGYSPEPTTHAASVPIYQTTSFVFESAEHAADLFALRKFKQDAEPLSAHAVAEVGRNAENRLRVVGIEVDLSLGKPAAEMQHIPRILDQFEAFCTVSQSVAAGIPIRLRVFDRDGQLLKGE